MASDAALEYILSRVRSDIGFLESQSAISSDAARQIRGLLVGGPVQADPSPTSAQMQMPSPAFPTPSVGGGSINGRGAPERTSSFASAAALKRTVPPPAPKQTLPPPSPAPQHPQAKALWDFAGNDSGDLPFKQGDVIDIIDESNPDWWTGRLNGREGMFPSNHVEKVATPVRSPPPPPPSYNSPQIGYSNEKAHYNAPPSGPPARNVYAPPPPSGPPNGGSTYTPYPPPSPYPGPGTYSTPPPPSAPAPAATPAPAEEEKKKKFGGVGGKMRDAAAGGLGFGVGAAVGSSLVSAIF
ncbi:hypothetical protein BOTBODRAFT_32805 [Botryobasidium botryosum FD-172 SS1]|uniref:SH3 domain-containing protein n=1 Tax=Botryobasidium botryosum (strain FD-172 SS1) TaxID=930990 RepID=A0A067MF23_BOTB1|nr:hypothetical protein BOTBODRAFT_32805 [Botryobasidium botryosum FD-172 SS1]